MTNNNKFNVIEGFAGPGGMSLGLKKAGFNLITAFDIDPKSVETFNRNLGKHSTVSDARNVSGSVLLNRGGLKVGEAIGHLPEPPLDYSVHPEYPNHQRARVTEINIERFSFVPQGGGWQDIPFEKRLDTHKKLNTSKGGWPDVYGRLKFDGQCPTITGGFDSFTRGRYGHPLENRPITPREAAILQGFPEKFVFVGNRGDIRSQIGNAVPPPLAEAIGKEIISSLSKNNNHT